MKRIMAKFFSLTLVLTLILSSSATFAFAATDYQKDETVYVNLTPDGAVEGLYVINAFESDVAQSITDYGHYSEIKNLSNGVPLKTADDKISLDLPEGRYYYQGNLDRKNLPWSINIRYMLDGVEIPAEHLAGKSGHLEIAILIDAGAEAYRAFYDQYMLQMSYTLSTETCKNVTSDQANLITTGKTINIGFTHAQPKPAQYLLSADVIDFEMGSITFRAVNRGKLEVDTTPLEDMNAQFNQLASSVSKLSDGAGKLTTISHSFLTHLTPLVEQSTEISQASGQVNSGIIDIDQSLNSLIIKGDALTQLANTLVASPDPQVQALAKGVIAQSQALQQLSSGTSKLSKQYAAFDEGLQKLPAMMKELQTGYIKINTATAELSSGISALNTEVSTIPEQMDSKVDNLLAQYTGEDFTPTSFAATDRPVDSVTFIMKTPEITIPAEPVLITAVEGEKNFWEKLLDLFGL